MSGIFESMGIDSGIVIIILLILTIILLINVVSSNMRLRRLERKYKMFMRGGDAQSLEKSFCKKNLHRSTGCMKQRKIMIMTSALSKKI